MKSMTGFGTARAAVGDNEVRVELRAVNHRFLDIRVRASGPLKEHGSAAEQLLRGKLKRAWDALSAWKQRAPGRNRVPMTQEILFGLWAPTVIMRHRRSPSFGILCPFATSYFTLFCCWTDSWSESMVAGMPSAAAGAAAEPSPCFETCP